jgi:hypothetical protein
MIRLPVSIGEAIDKLTILDIKCKRIRNETKQQQCKKEYDILHDELREHVEKCSFYYRLLYDVNDEIWVMQDDIRENPDPQKCVSILNKNDMRFRIKDIINSSVDSYLREQKGYPMRKALVLCHMGIGDYLGLNGAIRYIALQHDETVVVVKRENVTNVASFFSDNPSIKFWPVEDGAYILPPTNTQAGEIVAIHKGDYTRVYRSGVYTFPRNSFDDLPNGFYRDMGIDPRIRHTYFFLPTSEGAIQLYKNLESTPYIFVQQRSSSNMTPLVRWNIDEILTLDPNVNVYPEGHRWHSLAGSIVNKPMIDYIEIIKHAREIHTVDSSFYCMACYLPLDATVKRCYNRNDGTLTTKYDFT